nr:immunoglobulin light chain junction region [Macaca mulatta]MOW08883.1 immunoglobulin light chain junction region [Macaca mulatta]MOW09087.1 immunoglobulin light chain junction region [Macaca mulatta]MOW10089.1 immunoglobulin light chain junction region [Macaca mulatta]MOW10592.1 immunoglobulin light chain junction region [Macaca mulatta]
CQKYITAPLTF